MRMTLRGKSFTALRDFLILMVTRPKLFRKSITPGYMRAVDFYGLWPMFRVFHSAYKSYYAHYGRYPDLVHPKLYSEKITWQKFFTLLPVPQSGNKLLTHKFIPEGLEGVKTVPIVFQSRQPELPPNDAIAPGWYYLKANYGCNLFRPVEYPLSTEKRAELEALTAGWLEGEYGRGTGEWWYSTFPQEILLEQSLAEGGSATTWCFHTLGGQVATIGLARKIDGQEQVVRLAPDMSPLNFDRAGQVRLESYDDYGLGGELTRIATALAQAFDLVRIDLYVTPSREIFLGEVTLSPFNGLLGFPQEWDVSFGKLARVIGCKPANRSILPISQRQS